ncbi:hypothetical protein EJ04DRAFT_15617 [Polyplosphaeria fusca]|uniref:Uncharacterized protein n=1 Tax=Polyplosphaeria fusca TaxID=682080 RepID=A0A9P4UYA5_9PLEO|nr:hypothetical protein EJ04DRAFT_15617 [Polyplosphaeria fusca]
MFQDNTSSHPQHRTWQKGHRIHIPTQPSCNPRINFPFNPSPSPLLTHAPQNNATVHFASPAICHLIQSPLAASPKFPTGTPHNNKLQPPSPPFPSHHHLAPQHPPLPP